MIQILVDTLLRFSDLALVALGLSMVYGLVKFPNIAHVQYAMVGAYLAYAAHANNAPLPVALALPQARALSHYPSICWCFAVCCARARPSP